MKAGTAAAEPVDLSGARFSFGELQVIAALDLQVAAGEVLGVVGPSGCGKSTLLELACGLRDPDCGSVRVAGAPAALVRHAVLMPQRDSLLPWLSAADNAALPLRNRGASRADARAEALPLLGSFGLRGFEHASPARLSGGMRQRVAFARTLLAAKPVLALDEPFASLDAFTRAELQEWLAAELAREGRTTLLVSHDVEEALYLADRVVVLSQRPARVTAEITSPVPRAQPRTEAVTAPEFVAAREAAMRALEEAAS